MRAAVIRRFGDPEVLAIEEIPRPEIEADEMLVRVGACGVCGHDLLARAGKLGGGLPRVLGHEIAGTVERVGASVLAFAPGDRVVLGQRRACGKCSACRSGHPNHCTSGPGFYGEQLQGGYAEYVVAGPENTVRLPPEISDVTAAALPCGVATPMHAIRRLGLSIGETVAIVGAGGGVGVHAVSIAALCGARVIAVTHRPDKVAKLQDRGAYAVVAGDAGDIVSAVRSVAGGPVDAVVDCAGVTLNASLRMLRHGGRLALLGNIDPRALDLEAGLLILKEIELLGSSHGTPDELALAVELVRSGQVVPVLAATLPLAEASEAHRVVASGAPVGRMVLTLH